MTDESNSPPPLLNTPRNETKGDKLSFLILGKIFAYLPLKDLFCCALVCRHWNVYLCYEYSELWLQQSKRLLPQSALSDAELFPDDFSHKAKLRAFSLAWNPFDCSRNGYVKLNGFSFRRNPVAQSTDGVRGRRGFNSGRHSWECHWEGPLGTVALIGVASRHAALQCPGYSPLLGSDDQGWGWNLVTNELIHDGQILGTYPNSYNFPKFAPGGRIRVVLDCDAHVMFFERGHSFYGVAFTNLPPIKLYPCISSVYGNSEISMVYLGAPLDG